MSGDMTMKLTSLKFNNFKTVKGESIDIEKDITCLVGVNEAGKSNVLLGIEKCDSQRELVSEDISRHSDEYLKGGIPSLEMTLIPSSEAEQKSLKALFGASELNEIIMAKTGKVYRIDFPTIDYKKSSLAKEFQIADANPGEVILEADSEGKTQSVDHKNEETIRLAVVDALTDLLPRFRYFDSVDFDLYFLPLEGDVSIAELISNPDKHTPVINLLKLGDVSPKDLTNYSTPQEKTRRDTRLETATQQINLRLLRAFWPVETVQLSLSAEENTLKIRIRESKPFLPGERSRGLQWALAFNIFFLAATDVELANTVLLLDEPGIFLHIEGQRKMLASSFPEIVRQGNQIIYTTHLPYLIEKNYPERIRILEKENEDTKIGNKAWSESEFGSIPEPVRTALGLNIEEAFLFGERNLIVEGPADQIYLRILCHEFDRSLIDQLTLVPAYGVEKVPKVMGLSILSGKKTYGLVDADKDLDVLKNQFRTAGMEEPNIENIATLCGDAQIKTIEDILPPSIFRKAVFNVYRRVCQRRNRSLVIDEIPTNMPRKESVENFFRSKLTSPKHRLLKMDIARAFKEVTEGEAHNTPATEWRYCKKLVGALKTWKTVKKSTS